MFEQPKGSVEEQRLQAVIADQMRQQLREMNGQPAERASIPPVRRATVPEGPRQLPVVSIEDVVSIRNLYMNGAQFGDIRADGQFSGRLVDAFQRLSGYGRDYIAGLTPEGLTAELREIMASIRN